MGSFRLSLPFILLLTALAADSGKKPKPAVVEIQELKIAIDGAKVNIDGTVRNSGERSVDKLILSFHFFDTDHLPVTTLQLEVSSTSLEPGDDTEIHASANEPPRAVSMEITAADRHDKVLKVLKPGPYPIE